MCQTVGQCRLQARRNRLTATPFTPIPCVPFAPSQRLGTVQATAMSSARAGIADAAFELSPRRMR